MTTNSADRLLTAAEAPPDGSTTTRFLMARPDRFTVRYEINPWMHQDRPVDIRLATEQWEALRRTYRELGADVETLPAVAEQPDFVFVANAGLVQGGTVYRSRFRHPERRGEEPCYQAWFEAEGYRIVTPPPGFAFEGAAEVRLGNGWVWGGWGIRTDRLVHDWLAEHLSLPIVPLELVDPRFYHLDTCFNVLPDGIILYYPEAFAEAARTEIRRRAEAVIELTDEEGLAFVANCTVVDRTIVAGWVNPRLKQEFERRGFGVRTVDVSEFRKAGGSVACLTLPLSGPWRGAGGNAWNEHWSSSSPMESSGDSSEPFSDGWNSAD